jgi:hypothetical protein
MLKHPLCDVRLHRPALQTIGGISGIQGFGLQSAAITDAGIRDLTRILALSSLSLGATGVTDRAVEFIGRIKSLRIVDVRETSITKSGADRLRAMLPWAVIYGPGFYEFNGGATAN